MIIYLDGLLPNRSCDIGGGRAALLPHILHRIEFTAKICHHIFGWALTPPFHPCPLPYGQLAVYLCCPFP